MVGAGEPQNTLILMCGCHPHRNRSPLQDQAQARQWKRPTGGPPWPPDQPAQGLSAGSPLPQLRVVQGVTKPAFLTSGISSCQREPRVGSGASGTPSELEDNEYVVSDQDGERGGWSQCSLSGNVLRSRQCV